jgi:dTDP-4-amino-4,6-dideoxygalactose transaminase
MPPAANPVGFMDIIHGLSSMLNAEKALSRFTGELKGYYGVEHVYLTSSGKAALTLTLKAMKTLSPGRRRVVIPAYTCYSVPSAVIKAGLDVDLVDMDPDTLDFDRRGLKEKINENTLCVIPNHLFGTASDVHYVKGLAREAGAFVVEDAAQAMGVESNGVKLGSSGDAGFFSLGRGKNITAGSGGIIITNSPEISSAIDEFYSLIESPGAIDAIKGLLGLALMKLFMRPSLYWFPTGLPFLKLGETIFYKDFPVKKLSGMRAGVMFGWEERLKKLNEGRRRTAGKLISSLKGGAGGEVGGKEAPYLRLPMLASTRQERDRILGESKKLGLGMSLMYPSAVNGIEEIRDRFIGGSYPGAEAVAERLFALPTHCLLSETDKEAVIDLCKRTLNAGERPVTGLEGENTREACHNN